MILFAFAMALVAQPQWTGPRTEEYRGPGRFCGGGYSVSLGAGDRALILPQGHAPQATRVVLSGREVNIHTGAKAAPGKVVGRYGRTLVTEAGDGPGITYTVADDSGYGLSLTSDSFRGYKADRWFFSHANFRDDADEGVDCLSAYSL
jgi:hypothetical protein